MDSIKDELIYKKLTKFLHRGWMSLDDSVLIVCAGKFDQEVMDAIGFRNYLMTSMHEEAGSSLRNYKKEDVERLSFADNSYDNVIVNAGLHHCHSPHRALGEMYRVAKKNVVLFESQDSFIIRVFSRLGLAFDYELDAVIHNAFKSGGVNNTPIPNYVYRWTRREIEKFVRSLEPAKEPEIIFYSSFHYSGKYFASMLAGHALSRLVGARGLTALAAVGFAFLNLFFSGQGNNFMALIRKTEARCQPWIKITPEGRQVFRAEGRDA